MADVWNASTILHQIADSGPNGLFFFVSTMALVGSFSALNSFFFKTFNFS